MCKNREKLLNLIKQKIMNILTKIKEVYKR